MSDNILRFVFSLADQALIDKSSIVVEDTDDLQSMKISLRLVKEVKQGPQVYPLFPGSLTFMAASTDLPAWNEVDLNVATEYVGQIMVKPTPYAKLLVGLAAISGDLQVVPNCIWYSPVVITRDFLQNTLPIKKANIGGRIGINHRNWHQHAVAEFLAGKYEVQLPQDTSNIHLPRVQVVNKQVEIVIHTAAFQEKANDGHIKRQYQSVSAMKDSDPGLDPVHPVNGRIPARLVYRLLRADMIDNKDNEVADIILQDWPDGPRYFPIRFTRAWQPIQGCSVHFPGQRVQIMAPNGTVLHDQPLPAHGMVYLRQDPATPEPVPPTVKISIQGSMSWLDGSVANAWRVPSENNPIEYDLAQTSIPHIILRRSMRDEMLLENPVRSDPVEGCTYLSTRRVVRALINNWITGGRLSFGVGTTKTETRQLINDAWSGLPPNATFVARNNPPPLPVDFDKAQIRLRQILVALFPQTGELAANVWNSRIPLFQGATTKGDYDDNDIGRGGAGALKILGLATDYAVNPVRSAHETDRQWISRTAEVMKTGLEPGALLQYWVDCHDYEMITGRHVPGSDRHNLNRWGHSTVFKRYLGPVNDPTGIEVYDPHKTQKFYFQRDVAGNLKLGPAAIWIAANWDE